MRYLIAIVLALACSFASVSAHDRWIPDNPPDHPTPRPPTKRPECSTHYGHARWVWVPARQLRTYWVRLPCGALEQWEDIIPGHWERW